MGDVPGQVLVVEVTEELLHVEVEPGGVADEVLQLELVGHDFFVFLNAETNDVNVVYRRRDGNYGLIEPQVA